MSIYYTKVLDLMLILICLHCLPQTDSNLIPRVKRKEALCESLGKKG